MAVSRFVPGGTLAQGKLDVIRIVFPGRIESVWFRAAEVMREQRPGLVMRWILLLASLPLGMSVALQAVAGSADIEGAIRYQINGGRVTVEIERIANNTINLTTGTLYLTVRMTE